MSNAEKVNKKELIDNLIKILSIPSPTYQEKKLLSYFKALFRNNPKLKANYRLLTSNDSLIAYPTTLEFKPPNKRSNGDNHIALVGHLDVVPQHLTPFEKSGKIYGAGASDMQGSLAVFQYLIENLVVNPSYQISYIFYAREEMTTLKENGLNDLIEKFPDYFKSIDLALVAEPTNNDIHLGCVGSIHAEVSFTGKACHSARPWQGENALYAAAPFINQISKIKPKKHRVMGVDFFDVMPITESSSAPGITSIPNYWKCNVNFRYAPSWNNNQALKYLKETLIKAGVSAKKIKIKSHVPAGQLVESAFLKEIISKLKAKCYAKQAWTDVAQFGMLKIPAFNHGPGLTEKCHTNDEYIIKTDLIQYTRKLVNILS